MKKYFNILILLLLAACHAQQKNTVEIDGISVNGQIIDSVTASKIDTIHCENAISYIHDLSFITNDSLNSNNHSIILIRNKLFGPTAHNITINDDSIEGYFYKVIDKDKVLIEKIEELTVFKNKYIDTKRKLDLILIEKNKIDSMPICLVRRITRGTENYLLKSRMNGKYEELNFYPFLEATCSQQDGTESDSHLDCINSNEYEVLNKYNETVGNIATIFHSLCY